MLNKKSKILLTGHNGLVGSSILRILKDKGYQNIITIEKKKLDLRNQSRVFSFIKKQKPEAVINAAAKVGGIQANNIFKAEFIYDNLIIQSNVIHGSFAAGVKNLIFLGSSCVYPRNCRQPIKESYLLNGTLEKTNEPYAVAKIAGITMCESYNFQYKTNYKCLMPCNTFGPNDNYESFSSHFFPALIRKIHEAKVKSKKIVQIWGTGKPLREIIYVDDVAKACIYFLGKKTKESLINIGSSFEKNILDYAILIAKLLNAKVEFKLDKTKPDGTPRKLLDNRISKKYGWKPTKNIEESILFTYNYYLKNKKI
jgi:GDP-L-fucose synthase